MVWHFGLADQSFGSWQAAECVNHIQNSSGAIYSIHTVSKKKSVEVMPRNVNKGVALRRVLEHHQGRRNSSMYSVPSTKISFRKEDVKLEEESNVAEDAVTTSPETYYLSPQSRSISPSNVGKRGFIDFILCIGDDRQDEYMFEYLQKLEGHSRVVSITTTETADNSPGYEDALELLLDSKMKSRSVWTCTVGGKSSAAKFFLPAISDVLKILESLAHE